MYNVIVFSNNGRIIINKNVYADTINITDSGRSYKLLENGETVFCGPVSKTVIEKIL